MLFCGIVSPRAGDLEDVLDPGRAHEHRDGRLALVDGAHRLAPVGRVAQALLAEPVDELHVELACAVDGQLGAPVVDDDGGPAAFEPAELLERGLGIVALVARRAGRAAAREKTRWVGKIVRPGSSRLTSTTIMYPLAGVPTSSW